MNRSTRTSEFHVSIQTVLETLSTYLSPSLQPSYVFEHRALTPAKQLKQQEYCSQLDAQVSHRQSALTQAQEEEERLQRDEQLHLAKE